MRLVLLIALIYISSSYQFHQSLSTRNKLSLFNLYASSSVGQDTTEKTSSSTVSNSEIKNLKSPPGSLPLQGLSASLPASQREILSSWNEFQGLSEKEILTSKIESNSLRNDKSIALAYRRCEYVTQLFSKTFYMGTSLMRKDCREHVWAIYAWCRRTDDIVDSPRALLNKETLKTDLRDWSDRLDRIWKGQPLDLFDLAMSETVKVYPTLSVEPFRDMIDGMIMDVPGLGQERYKNFEELYVYCYRVAGTVGLMTLPILGTSEGVTEKEAAEPAIALGIGFQLTNILRDVGEDLERGRIYLPQDELESFGLTEEDLFRCEVTDKYRKFMKFQIARARDYYALAKKGVPMLGKDARFAVQASLDLYSRILDVIERNDYDNFRKRAFTTKLEKLSILPNSFLQSR